MFWNKKINTEEYLELKKALEGLRISFEGLKLEFDLITKKLKVKYKLTNRNGEDKEEDLKSSVLLPEV